VARAAAEWTFDPECTFVIGDQVCDIELGQRLGATTFLVRTGYGEHVAIQGTVNPDYTVDSIEQSARVIEHLLTIHERTI